LTNLSALIPRGGFTPPHTPIPTYSKDSEILLLPAPAPAPHLQNTGGPSAGANYPVYSVVQRPYGRYSPTFTAFSLFFTPCGVGGESSFCNFTTTNTLRGVGLYPCFEKQGFSPWVFYKCLYFLIPYLLIIPSLSLLLLIFKKWENLLLWGISVLLALSGFIVFSETLPCISFPPNNWQLTFKILLENFAETLNIFKLFRNNQMINIKFLHTLYSIAIAFLTYQMIVAIRRQVRR